jgi:hypothetical protein
MEQIPNQGEDEDLGGERACWLDEVCVSCGAIHGHRPGCELAGIGGGAFSGFMPSTSYFFPRRLQGTARGLQAGIGNSVSPWSSCSRHGSSGSA